MGRIFSEQIPVSEFLAGVALSREIGPTYSDIEEADRMAGSHSTQAIAPKTERNESWWNWIKRTVVETSPGIDWMFGVSAEFQYREKRYAVMKQAPRFYGFSLMILLAGFPMAGLFAMLPRGWLALFNWGKLFVSVKLWPLFWNLLYTYSSLSLDQDELLLIPAVYLMIPGISFLFVQILTTAAGSAVTQMPVYSGVHPLLNMTIGGAAKV